ncbi:MAG: DEAD/DEAH box helicase [Phycisphaerales bacterium]
MLVLHAVWTRDRLHLWAEDDSLVGRALEILKGGSSSAHAEPDGTAAPTATATGTTHSFACAPARLRGALVSSGLLAGDDLVDCAEPIRMHLPATTTLLGTTPLPSDRFANALGVSDDTIAHLSSVEVPALAVESPAALKFLLAPGEDDRPLAAGLYAGHDLRFWREVAALAADLIADQRIVPSLIQEKTGRFRAVWQPWLADGAPAERLNALLAAIPASARCVDDEFRSQPWAIIEAALLGFVDAEARRALELESYVDAIDGRDPTIDPHVAWLTGLLGKSDTVEGVRSSDTHLMRGARQWLSSLDAASESRFVRLAFELNEPDPTTFDANDEVGRNAEWTIAFKLITNDDPPVVIDAEQIWAQGKDGLKGLLARFGGEGEPAGDVLLAELARASRIWPRVEKALEDAAPCELRLSTTEAYAFLRDFRPILMESGFVVLAPGWWGQPASRLGARLLIDSGGAPLPSGGGTGADGEGSHLGLHSLVNYSWQIALGDQSLSIEAFQRLAAQGSPLLRVNGQWVEIRPDDLHGAVRFLKEHPGGQMTVMQAIRLGNGLDGPETGLPILGLDAQGWVSELLGFTGDEKFIRVDQPERFQGTLRPYQQQGLSWLAFLDRFGLGGCLADDMGLGKTVQLIALLQHEREKANGRVVGPTLLVCPMSVVGNWNRELHRFAPELVVHIHHGLERPTGEKFVETALSADIVVTTYALVVRDRESLERVHWRRIVLDEAQHIKNPPTKQTASIRALRTSHRIALTGTPVENRLSELWSILEFCTPGYLGSQGEFRRRFAAPIERHKDRRQAERLKNLVRPFVLRRLKTDPTVISDLPPLVETRQNVPLTSEQAQLYDSVVNDMLHRVDNSEGIKRRGLVLSALVKLKQICNHPAHFLREGTELEVKSLSGVKSGERMSARSGKAMRLMEMVEEVVAVGDRALIFTQYRQMGHLLVAMLRQELDTEALFLHGGTPQAKREQLIERFQSNDPSCPIFVLSLKAGGVGLNLTAANHVFHFDRWWNPAVENQATDRAFRIGQHRTVNVHKMISEGTLEERIDQMIEQKTELAQQIIGSGESWLTELSTGQLRELLTLRRDTLEEEE